MTEPTDEDQLESRLKGYLQRFTTFPRSRQSALDSSLPGLERRPRRLGVVAALAAVAVCVTGTATAALVVTLHRVGDNPAVVASTGTSGGHIFIPAFGGGQASSGQGSAAQGPASPAIGAAPAPLSAGRFNSALNAGFPAGGAQVWNYSCGGGGSAQVVNGQVQVQGMATIGSPDQATTQLLTIQVSGAGATNKAAVTDAQAREVAVDTAMQAAGIRSADITLQPVQIGQNGYVYYNPGQGTKPSATAIITVSSTDPVQLATAADAAQKAGGSQVTSWGAYGTQFGTPSSSDLASAIRNATGSAHDEAAAVASASGLHLGKVAGLTSSPPSLCYGAGGESLVVTVTINYAVSS